MHINEAPNDKADYRGKGDIRKKLYVTLDDGSYTSVMSQGWAVENFATKQAWNVIEEEMEAIRRQVIQGKLSPIAFYMHKSLMELPILARYMGLWKWQVKRHLKPTVFKKLKPEILQRYAGVFDISVDALKSLS